MLGMFGGHRGRNKNEGEKPFWISYADLMTAMMVLFLAAMAVTIAIVTRTIDGGQSKYKREVASICEQIGNTLKDAPDIQVDCANQRITFPRVGTFPFNSYSLSPDGEAALARLVPAVLEAADSELGKKWLKQIVVEGYTDPVGGYLYNLHLSLQRSEYVLCLLMDPNRNRNLSLTEDQLARVRRLFLAGGVSFNNQRSTAEESRRVELRIQFYGMNEEHEQARVSAVEAGAARMDRCQL